jgi:16S rRNA (guanine527-N7)-methyltransferase
LTKESIIDVGAGAGFPGLPLKIKCPGIKLTLLEATGKKVEFLREIVHKLGLNDVKVIKGRAEEVGQEQREIYDIAVARAVAKLNVLAEYCLPFVKVGGLFIAYKEEKIADEVAQANKAFEILGGKLKEIKQVKLKGSDIMRSLVIVEKISPTPHKYPRRSGQPAKKALQ